MKIYDISQQVFSCKVYPGDPKPEKVTISAIESGGLYNLTAFSMCAHNGTHVDAPFHFLQDGKSVDQMELTHFVGECLVVRWDGAVTEEAAKAFLEKCGAVKRLLIAGKATVTEEAATVFARSGLLLLGNESQTVGPEDGPMAVHLFLLGAGMALLEGIVLEGIPEGKYLLSAAPLNLAGADGAPCRAVLMEPHAGQC